MEDYVINIRKKIILIYHVRHRSYKQIDWAQLFLNRVDQQREFNIRNNSD